MTTSVLRRSAIIHVTALIALALIPSEQPAVDAEHWMSIQNEDLCIDYDAQRVDGDWMYWVYAADCTSASAPRRGKANCRAFLKTPVARRTWYDFDQETQQWEKLGLDEAAPIYRLVSGECHWWATKTQSAEAK